MLAVGGKLAALCAPGVSFYLSGPLGAGKTTLARGILHGLGYAGRVKSPSYALVESYMIAQLPVYHIDLYRLADAREIENLGMRDYMDGRAVCLLEWPERAQGRLPPPSVHIDLAVTGEDKRSLQLSFARTMKHNLDEQTLNDPG